MSLTAAINIGRTALNASSVGIQVASNNMANAATPGYSRQIARISPLRGGGNGVQLSIGAGVQLTEIQRQIDLAVEARLRNAVSDDSAAGVLSGLYSATEATLGELGDSDLSSQLSAFFRSWSERANQTQSSAAVIQQGDQLAQFVRRLRSDLSDQRSQIDAQLGRSVEQANSLISSIANLNRQISDAEVGSAPANTLRDQRDQAISQLSQLMDVAVVDRGREGTDVLVGSTPIVLGGTARGLQMIRQNQGNGTSVSITTVSDQARLDISSGQIGAYLGSRSGVIDSTISRLDKLTSQIIFQVNKLHSTGTNGLGLTSTLGTLAISGADQARALNDPANQTLASLPFSPLNGSFTVNVRDRATGATQSVLVKVDLDGMTNSGTPGTADDTSAEDLRAAIGAIPGLSASFTPEGKLQVTAAAGFDFSFSDDTSGAVATLGLNSFFTGTSAADIGVRDDLRNDSSQLTAGRMINGALVENGTALAVAGLQDQGIAALGGLTIQDHWRDTFQAVGSASATAQVQAGAAGVVRQNLEAQRAGVSGVSVDEESINLLDFQRQCQAAARVISVADQLTQTLMELV